MGLYRQCKERGYATPVDMLMDIGVLTKAKYEDWRFGRIPFLEAACTVNLHRLSFAMKQMRSYARKAGVKPSYCYYKHWGVKKKPGQKRPVLPLHFSKYGDPDVEKWYSTHYVDSKRITEIKQAAFAENGEERSGHQAEVSDNEPQN